MANTKHKSTQKQNTKTTSRRGNSEATGKRAQLQKQLRLNFGPGIANEKNSQDTSTRRGKRTKKTNHNDGNPTTKSSKDGTKPKEKNDSTSNSKEKRGEKKNNRDEIQAKKKTRNQLLFDDDDDDDYIEDEDHTSDEDEDTLSDLLGESTKKGNGNTSKAKGKATKKPTSTTETRNSTEETTTRKATKTATKETRKNQETLNQKEKSRNNGNNSNNEQTNNKVTSTAARKHKLNNQSKMSNGIKRQCKRIEWTESDDNSESTRQGNNRGAVLISTLNQSRATMKITVPASENPGVAVAGIIKDFVKVVHDSADNDFELIPWYTNGQKHFPVITKSEDVPTQVTKLRPYFPKLYPGKANKISNIYTNVLLGHNESFSDICTDIRFWLQAGKHGLYYNMLQDENPECIGWFLYSAKSMGLEELAQEISDMWGIQVGLRWKIIDIGKKGNIPEDQRVHAVHIEVAKGEKSQLTKFFLQKYGKKALNASELPNGIRFRFVTLRTQAGRDAKTKLDRLRIRQQKFLNAIDTHGTWDILHLDWGKKCDDDKSKFLPTLRNMVMDIYSKQFKNTNLFHSVDLEWDRTGFVFTFMKEMKDEAEGVISTLLPYLEYLYGKESGVDEYFTEETKLRTEDMYYDEEKQMVIDPLVDQNLEFLDEEDLLGKQVEKWNNENPIATQQGATSGGAGNVARPMPADLNNAAFRPDDDTISTLGGGGASMLIADQNARNERNYRAKKKQAANTEDDAHSTSVSTSITDASFQTLQETVERLNVAVQQNQTQFSQIMNLLQENQAQSSQQARTPNTNSASMDTGGDKSSAGEVRE